MVASNLSLLCSSLSGNARWAGRPRCCICSFRLVAVKRQWGWPVIARSGVPSDLWDSKELWERVLHIILERKHFQRVLIKNSVVSSLLWCSVTISGLITQILPLHKFCVHQVLWINTLKPLLNIHTSKSHHAGNHCESLIFSPKVPVLQDMFVWHVSECRMAHL